MRANIAVPQPHSSRSNSGGGNQGYLKVAGVTAKTAAQLVGVNKNTAAYYFHRLLLLYFTTAHIRKYSTEKLRLTKVILVKNLKTNGVAVLQEKLLYSSF